MRTLAALLLMLPLAPDRLEMMDGTVYEGRLISEKGDIVHFEVLLDGGAKAELDFPVKSIKAMVVGGKRRTMTEPPPKAPKPEVEATPAAPTAGPKEKPKAEVQALIKKVGMTPPDWFQATPLNFPGTLDLSWSDPPPGSPWDPSKNVGQFIWTSINENEARWKEGIRFLHHLLTVNQKNPVIVKRTMAALGNMYHNLHEDWARAAFWWEKAGETDNVSLAHCYFKLGSRAMAEEILRKYPTDFTRHCDVARLWGEMGDVERGLKVALQTATSTPDVGFLAAGDLCRLAGRYPEALQHYAKVVASTSGGRDLKQAQGRAQASIDAIKLVDTLNLKKVPDGAYRDSSVGYSGPVAVEVTVAGGKIAAVKVVQHTEKQYYSSIADTTRQLVAKQGAKGVDATSGATITSEAIINASLKALGKGQK